MPNLDNGPQGQPRYDLDDGSEFPTHLTEVSEYAAKVGNRKRGSTAQRLALEGEDRWIGLSFYDETLKRNFTYEENGWRADSQTIVTRGNRAGAGWDGSSRHVIQSESSVLATTGGTATFTFPEPFPTGVAAVIATVGDTGLTAKQVIVGTITLNGFTAQFLTGPGASVGNANVRVNYVAIGW